MTTISSTKCSLTHEIEYRDGHTIKCTNRNCYEAKMKDSDWCIHHHHRDECPDTRAVPQ